MMFNNKRKIDIKFRKESPVVESPDTNLLTQPVPNVSLDGGYVTLVDYLLQHGLQTHFSLFNKAKEEARAIRECATRKMYVKHVKHPRLGLILTFPVSVLDVIYNHLKGKNEQ